MRRVLTGLLTITAALSCAAKVTVLPQLPQGELPDCEVVTNVALTANLANLEALRFTLDFEPSASNELAVAVGADADGDGDLSLEEAAVVFGCDCGGWYRVDGTTGAVATNGFGGTEGDSRRQRQGYRLWMDAGHGVLLWGTQAARTLPRRDAQRQPRS